MEIMLNDIKTTSIDTFQKIFESNIESSMKKSFSEIENKIKEDITTNIMKQIRGDNTYNYSLIPNIKIKNTLDNPSYSSSFDITNGTSEKFKQFMIMKDNEKIVFSIGQNNNLLLTNYGKLWFFDNSNLANLDEHKFWVPTEYINIFKILIDNNYFMADHNANCGNGRGRYTNYGEYRYNYNIINKSLIQLKTSLFSNKFVPSYIKEENDNMKLELETIRIEKEHFIVEKNKQITLELEIIRKEKEEFIKVKTQYLEEEYINMNLELEKHRKEKAKFNLDIIPYIDLINDRQNLEVDKLEQSKHFETEKKKLEADILVKSEQLEKYKIEQLKLFNSEKQKFLDKTKIQEQEYAQFKLEKGKFQLLILKYKKDKTDLQEEKKTLEKDKATFIQEKEDFIQEKIKAYSINEEI